MTRNKALALIAMAAMMLPLASQAGDAKAAASQATTLCAGCHGAKGVSSNPLWPNLAGQQEQYIAKQLRDYKEGRRQDPVMAPLAMTLDDKAIDDLAAYFSALPAGG
jgi:cytochrome c553